MRRDCGQRKQLSSSIASATKLCNTDRSRSRISPLWRDGEKWKLFRLTHKKTKCRNLRGIEQTTSIRSSWFLISSKTVINTKNFWGWQTVVIARSWHVELREKMLFIVKVLLINKETLRHDLPYRECKLNLRKRKLREKLSKTNDLIIFLSYFFASWKFCPRLVGKLASFAFLVYAWFYFTKRKR